MVKEQLEILPYDPKWEFPMEKLKLGRYNIRIQKAEKITTLNWLIKK